MRVNRIPLALLLLSVAAAPALASFGGHKDEPPPSSSTTSTSTDASAAASSARQEAEKWYGDAYSDVGKADKLLADGKTKDAEKKYKRGLERGERATGIDSSYYEAFNLVGYCARNLKQYDKSLTAYTKCLSIKSDYAPAREYLGELYVEMGRVNDAREQVAWLKDHEAEDSAATLQAKIDAKAPAPGNGITSAAPASAADTLRTKPAESNH